MIRSFLEYLFGERKQEDTITQNVPVINDIICEKYKVKGRNKSTKRMRTVEVVAWNQASDEDILQKACLTEPYEIQVIGFEKPTEKQISYARELGVCIPRNASKKDASILISRAVNQEPIRQEKAPKDMLEILIKKLGIYIPAYAGEKEMNIAFYYSMKTMEERYAYFAMKVYAQSTGKNYHFIYEASKEERERFREFAKEYKNDKSFTASFDRYHPEEISVKGKIKRKLKAYELANAFFYERL